MTAANRSSICIGLSFDWIDRDRARTAILGAHGSFGGLETDLGMRAVAKRLAHRTTAAAKREGGLAIFDLGAEVEGVSVGVNHLDGSGFSFDAKGSVIADCD